MDNKVLNEAVENISLIKGLIERTSKSFASFSKIFICWGILFIFNSIVQLLVFANFEKTMALSEFSPVIYYVFPMGIVALLAAIIYRSVSKKSPLIGLEKHLLILWLLILVMNVIPNKFVIDTGAYANTFERIIVHANNLSMTNIQIFSSNSFIQVTHAIPLPFTFLYTGFYLKLRQVRGD